MKTSIGMFLMSLPNYMLLIRKQVFIIVSLHLNCPLLWLVGTYDAKKFELNKLIAWEHLKNARSSVSFV